jgi:hypothetical protein
MEITFKISQKIKEAWKLYKENLGNIILFIVAMFVFQLIVSFLFKGGQTESFLSSLVKTYVSFFFSFLLIKSTIDMVDGKSFNPLSKENLLDFSGFWNFLKINLLLMLCVAPVFIISLLAVFLLAILGKSFVIIVMILAFIIFTYIGIRLLPSIYLVIDKNQGARKSIIESWNMTKGYFWFIFGKVIVIQLFVLLGFIALLIGGIITYPIGMMVTVMLYRELLKNKITPEIIIAETPIIENKEEVISEKVADEIV